MSFHIVSDTLDPISRAPRKEEKRAWSPGGREALVAPSILRNLKDRGSAWSNLKLEPRPRDDSPWTWREKNQFSRASYRRAREISQGDPKIVYGLRQTRATVSRVWRQSRWPLSTKPDYVTLRSLGLTMSCPHTVCFACVCAITPFIRELLISRVAPALHFPM